MQKQKKPRDWSDSWRGPLYAPPPSLLLNQSRRLESLADEVGQTLSQGLTTGPRAVAVTAVVAVFAIVWGVIHSLHTELQNNNKPVTKT